MTQNKPSVIGLSLIIALMIIPTAISIFVALQVKEMKTISDLAVNGEPQIVCFAEDICAIEVHSKWYRISGVISMDETVPDEYKLDELLSEAQDVEPIEESVQVIKD